LPLEDFAMERVVAKIKELSGNFGLEVGVEFEASETTDRQLVEFADFTFSSGAMAATPKKPAAAPQAQAPKAPAAPTPAAQAPAAQAPAAQAPAGSPAAVTR
jgi:hypothetical protein